MSDLQDKTTELDSKKESDEISEKSDNVSVIDTELKMEMCCKMQKAYLNLGERILKTMICIV